MQHPESRGCVAMWGIICRLGILYYIPSTEKTTLIRTVGNGRGHFYASRMCKLTIGCKMYSCCLAADKLSFMTFHRWKISHEILIGFHWSRSSTCQVASLPPGISSIHLLHLLLLLLIILLFLHLLLLKSGKQGGNEQNKGEQ